nr:MAG TPA: hypothetical protein [Microviridae sp.]
MTLKNDLNNVKSRQGINVCLTTVAIVQSRLGR